MADNRVVNVGEANKITQKNLKPFLGAFIILIILLLGYYFLWRSITVKMKNVVTDSLKNFKYDSIDIGGFPFSKKVKVKNITFANNVFLITKNQVNVQEITISSFIFSGSLDVNFKEIKTINMGDNTSYSLAYNEEPYVNIGFYSNGRLKNFSYSDVGYRVVSVDNKTLYTSEKSRVDVKSIADGDKIDYALEGEFQKMQNINIMEGQEKVPENIIPEAYSMKFDISSSITKKDGVVDTSIIKINSLDVIGDQGNGISLKGQINKDPDDPYSFGELRIALSNYSTLMTQYRAKVLEALAIENKDLSPAEQKEYVDLTNKMFSAIDTTIKKHPDTKGNNGVVVVSRKKNTPDYSINGDSLFGIIQTIIQ